MPTELCTCGHQYHLHGGNTYVACAMLGCSCTKFEGGDGPAVASPPATAGPTLHQATQAAAKELWQLGPINSAALCNDVARVAVEAAWTLLERPLEDAHNRNHLLKIEVRDLQHRLEAGADALEELHTAQTQNEQLWSALDELIWVADFYNEDDEYCCECHGNRPEHLEQCWLPELLDRATEDRQP